MKRLLGVLVALGLLMGAAPALAAQVQLVVPYRSLEVGQEGQAQVVITNGRPASIPQLASSPGLDVRYLSQEQSTEIINFSRTSSVSFIFGVKALEEGTFTVGPATVQVDGKPMQTGTVTLTVQPPPPGQAAMLQAYAKPSVDTAWEGQTVLYEYGLRSRMQVLRSSWVTLPVTQLATPSDGQPVRRQYTIDDPNGTIWVDETWEPFLVTGAKDMSFEPAVVQVEVPAANPLGRMRLFQPTRTMTAASDPSHLKVRPLPPPPPGFSGLVGDFDITSQVAQTSAAVGQSIEWTIHVHGDGALDGFKVPAPKDTANVRFYDGSPVVNANVDEDGYKADGKFTRVIVPTKAGELTVPPLEIITFSPKKGRYVTHHLTVPPIKVTPGREGKGEVESYGPDGSVKSQVPKGPKIVDFYPIYPTGRAHAFFVAPWLLLVAAGIAAVGSVPLLLEGWVWLQRLRPARVQVVEAPLPQQLLERLPEAPADRLTVLDEALRDALARHAKVPPRQVDRHQVVASLPVDLRQRVDQVARALERARFAGDAPGPDLADRVREVVRALEEAA